MSGDYGHMDIVVDIHLSGRTCCLHLHHTLEDHNLQIQRDQSKPRKLLVRITNLVAEG